MRQKKVDKLSERSVPSTAIRPPAFKRAAECLSVIGLTSDGPGDTKWQSMDRQMARWQVSAPWESEVHVALMEAIQYTKWYLADTVIQNGFKYHIECFYL